jgi:transposase-like protein
MAGCIQKELIKYSESFKLQVVKEIEESGIAVCTAQKKYDIKGGSTIQQWLKKYGKHHLLAKVVRVETPDEKNQIKHLKEEVRKLESALAKSQVKIIALESLIEVAEEEYKVDFKKNFGQKQSMSDATNQMDAK